MTEKVDKTMYMEEDSCYSHGGCTSAIYPRPLLLQYHSGANNNNTIYFWKWTGVKIWGW